MTVRLPYLERGWGVPGEEGLLLILHHLGDDLLLLQPYPGLLSRTHLPQQDSEGIHICSLYTTRVPSSHSLDMLTNVSPMSKAYES